jgi:hypothetical protein
MTVASSPGSAEVFRRPYRSVRGFGSAGFAGLEPAPGSLSRAWVTTHGSGENMNSVQKLRQTPVGIKPTTDTIPR